MFHLTRLIVPRHRYSPFFEQLQHRFRLVLYDDTTLAEAWHARPTRLKLYGWLSALLLLGWLAALLLIAFTPLREYVPGYGSLDTYRRALRLQRSTDSLAAVSLAQAQYIGHLRSIFADTIDMPIPTEAISPLTEWADSGANTDIVAILDTLSTAELDLRREIEQTDHSPTSDTYESGIADLFFCTPAEGYVSQSYNPAQGHFGIDIAGSEAAPIKAVCDGMVLLADYSPENGYTIVLQHAHDLVSVYKHNAAVLKKNATFVRTGEVIAHMGKGTAELNQPIHLHFELWHRQNPVNPADYIWLMD